MEMGLDGMVVVVTGSSRGVGRAVAVGLARERAIVVLTGRTEATLRDAEAEVRKAGAPDVGVFRLDLTDADELNDMVTAVAQRFGSIDGLVNNLGGPDELDSASGFLDITDDMWDMAYRKVLMVSVHTCRAVIPIMLRQGHGTVVNVSGQAIRQHIPRLAHHEGQKAAVAHLTKSLAKEFAPTIRVNAVLPGAIATEDVQANVMEPLMATNEWSEAELIDHMNRQYYELTWSKRLARPTEIADAIIYLLSTRASYINGAWLNIDGGSSPG